MQCELLRGHLKVYELVKSRKLGMLIKHSFNQYFKLECIMDNPSHLLEFAAL